MKKLFNVILILSLLVFLLFSNIHNHTTYGKPINNPNKDYLTESSILSHIEDTYKNGSISDSYIKSAENYLEGRPLNCNTYFALGYFKYISKDYNDAIKDFINARNSLNNTSSYFVKIYTYIFLNRCLIEENTHFGRYSGLIENAEQAIKYIKEDSKFKNNTYVLNDLFKTLTTVDYTRNSAIDLLNDYMNNTSGLIPQTKMELNYSLANFYMLNFRYADAAYVYLDIINLANNEKDLKHGDIYKVKSYTYLGNISFQLTNYKNAIDFFNYAIDIPVENKKANAQSKIGAYINIVDAYTNLNYYASAEEAAKKVPPLLNYLSKDYKDDVEIVYYNTIARLDIREKDLESAKLNLDKCFSLLNSDTVSIASDKDMFVNLTYGDYLLATGSYNDALTVYKDDLKESNKRGGMLNIDIYEGIMKTYEALDDSDNALYYSKKLLDEETKLQKEIDKDYISYTIKAYESEQLKNKQNTEQLWMLILLAVITILAIIVITRVRLIKILEESNFKDGMTKLFNRKYLDSFVGKNKEFLDKNELSTILIDIDYFKNYNDNYGHVKGDEIIKSVSNSILNNIRKGDIPIRYGGEELVVVLPKTSLEEAKIISQKILDDISFKNIEHKYSLVSNKLTVSIGIYFKKANITEDIYEVIHKADKALYKAKNSGRNRFEVFSSNI